MVVGLAAVVALVVSSPRLFCSLSSSLLIPERTIGLLDVCVDVPLCMSVCVFVCVMLRFTLNKMAFKLVNLDDT